MLAFGYSDASDVSRPLQKKKKIFFFSTWTITIKNWIKMQTCSEAVFILSSYIWQVTTDENMSWL